MEFKYVIYRQKELMHNGCLDTEIGQLFRKIRRHGIKTASVLEGSLSEYMNANKILPESVLVLAASDCTIKEAAGLSAAVLGYKNPDFSEEKLDMAEFVAEGFEEVDYYFLERVYQRKHGIPWRVIETERCYLREMTPEDLPDLYRLYDGEGMTEYMEPLYGWDEEMEYTKAYIENMYRFYGYGMWLVKERITDELIGRAGFDHYMEDGECMLEMGYAIGVPFQRMGYAAEVCRAIIAYAKSADLGHDELYCFVREENKASRALLDRLGFEFQKTKIRNGEKMRQYRIELK